MKLRCPRCKSTKVYLVPDLPNNTNIYYCKKCTEIFAPVLMEVLL